jgi:hypothetical protein
VLVGVPVWGLLDAEPVVPLVLGLVIGGLVLGLVEGLLHSRVVVINVRTPKDTRSRSLITALTSGLEGELLVVLGWGLVFGLVVGLDYGGWFVLLQKAAHRRLARAGNLPPRPYDFLERGIERKILHPVGGVSAFATASFSST